MNFVEYMSKKANEKDEKTKASHVNNKNFSPVDQLRIDQIMSQIQKGKDPSISAPSKKSK